MRRTLKSVLGLAAMLPVAALAQTAYTNQQVNMRAGPNPQFPMVATIPAGVPVYVNGCVTGYTWCDVSVGGQDRGWIYADYLSYPYRNQPVTVISGGAVIGLPIITFSVGNYWDSYYRGRPWYGNRAYWYGRPANWWHQPPRYYAQPIVRTYPGGRWDGDRRWHDDRHWDNGRHWTENRGRYDNNYRGPHNNNNRPPQQNIRTPHRDPTTANIRDERRNDRPVTGERDQTSKSARTYSQQ